MLNVDTYSFQATSLHSCPGLKKTRNKNSIGILITILIDQSLYLWYYSEFTRFITAPKYNIMTSSNGNKFPLYWPLTRNFDVFFDLRLNKWLSKQSWGWWFETPSHPVWRDGNELKSRETSLDIILSSVYVALYFHNCLNAEMFWSQHVE